MNQKRIITVLAGSAMLAGLLTGCGAEPGIGKSEEPVKNLSGGQKQRALQQITRGMC